MTRRIPSLFLGFILCLTGCPNPNTSKKNRTPAPNNKEIVATIGQQTITRQAFLKRYKKFGAGVEPQQFLRQLIDEKMLLLEATRFKLRQTKHVKNIERKALAQSLLKNDFEKTFNPKNINVLEVRSIYNARRHLYVKPDRVQAWHVLAKFPRSLWKETSASKKQQNKQAEKWSAAERKQRQKIKQARLKQTLSIATEVLQAIIQKKPKDAQAFRRAALPFLRKYNRPNAQLHKWFTTFHQAVATYRARPAGQLSQQLEKLCKPLKYMYYCDMCIALEEHLTKYAAKWKRGRKPPSPKVLKNFYNIAKRGIQRPTERLRIRQLGTFSYQAMVAPFAKAAFAMKNQTFSRTLIRTKFGYHIIFRSGFLPASSVPFSKVEPILRRELYEKRASKLFRRWLYFTKKKYKIQRNYKNLRILQKRQR